MYEFKRQTKRDLVEAISIALDAARRDLGNAGEKLTRMDSSCTSEMLDHRKHLLHADIEFARHRMKSLEKSLEATGKIHNDAVIVSVSGWVWERYAKWFEGLTSISMVVKIGTWRWVHFNDEGEAIASHLFLEGELECLIS